MLCLGFEPWAAGWQAQMAQLSYGGHIECLKLQIFNLKCIRGLYVGLLRPEAEPEVLGRRGLGLLRVGDARLLRRRVRTWRQRRGTAGRKQQ